MNLISQYNLYFFFYHAESNFVHFIFLIAIFEGMYIKNYCTTKFSSSCHGPAKPSEHLLLACLQGEVRTPPKGHAPIQNTHNLKRMSGIYTDQWPLNSKFLLLTFRFGSGILWGNPLNTLEICLLHAFWSSSCTVKVNHNLLLNYAELFANILIVRWISWIIYDAWECVFV